MSISDGHLKVYQKVHISFIRSFERFSKSLRKIYTVFSSSVRSSENFARILNICPKFRVPYLRFSQRLSKKNAPDLKQSFTDYQNLMSASIQRSRILNHIRCYASSIFSWMFFPAKAKQIFIRFMIFKNRLKPNNIHLFPDFHRHR